MKYLMKYPWVKLPRNRVPAGKGIMGAWMRLAARAAFRRGEARYCGYNNPVEPGIWVGGIVGLKAILGLRRRDAALDVLRELERLGFLSWSLDPSTKKLSYPCDTVAAVPSIEEISALLGELRRLGRAQSFDRVTMNRVIAWYSRHASAVIRPKSRAALSDNIYRAYLSPVELRTADRNDCGGISIEEGLSPPGLLFWLHHNTPVPRKSPRFSGEKHEILTKSFVWIAAGSEGIFH